MGAKSVARFYSGFAVGLGVLTLAGVAVTGLATGQPVLTGAALGVLLLVALMEGAYEVWQQDEAKISAPLQTMGVQGVRSSPYEPAAFDELVQCLRDARSTVEMVGVDFHSHISAPAFIDALEAFLRRPGTAADLYFLDPEDEDAVGERGVADYGPSHGEDELRARMRSSTEAAKRLQARLGAQRLRLHWHRAGAKLKLKVFDRDERVRAIAFVSSYPAVGGDRTKPGLVQLVPTDNSASLFDTALAALRDVKESSRPMA